MALDSKQKRMSAAWIGLPWRGPLVDASESGFTQGNRQAAAFVYSGILAGEAVVVTPTQASGRNQRRVGKKDPWFPGNQDDWTPKTTAEVMNVEVEELPMVSAPNALTVEDEQEIERLIHSAETLSAETSMRLVEMKQKAEQLRLGRRREEEEELILMAILRRN